MTTESDRELLEMAAKAAGYVLDYTIRPDGKAFYHSDRNALALADGGWFAPLTDDGDALRLAVKCRLTVCLDGAATVSAHEAWRGDAGAFVTQSVGQCRDKMEATRRAITRAAASIGRGES